MEFTVSDDYFQKAVEFYGIQNDPALKELEK
jgi:hypothetical protein